MKAIDKEDRALLAELEHASVHACYIVSSLMKQWVWGLSGGHVEGGVEFPSLNTRTEGDRKWLYKQCLKIERHAWDCLGLRGFKSGQNISNGLFHSINAKVDMLNGLAKKILPDQKDYRLAIVSQTGVLLNAVERLKELEKHREPCWRYLVQTLTTLCKHVTKPEEVALINAIYEPMADVLAGMECICDWRMPE